MFDEADKSASALELAEAQLQQELRSMFEVDTQKYLQTYLDLAMQLQSGSWNKDIQAMYRAIHTIKGGAVTVAAEPILKVATVLEDMLSDMRYLDLAPPLEDGELKQMLLEAGELLASTITLPEMEGEMQTIVQPTVQRIQTLHQLLKQNYLSEDNEQQQLYQEFAEHGFDLVVLELEMAVEKLPSQGRVPEATLEIARQTISQLEQIGQDIEFASGWTELLQQAEAFFGCLENIFWRSQWISLFLALKNCAKQGGKPVPFQLEFPSERAIETESELLDVSEAGAWLLELSPTEALDRVEEFSDLTAASDFLDKLEVIETIPDSTSSEEAIENEEKLPQPLNPANNESQEKPQIPVPLERLDRSAQYLIETLLSVRATQNFHQTLQNQLVQLVTLAREGVQHITRLRQIQDDYALLDNFNSTVNHSSSSPTPERYRQGYSTINRLLEMSLRLSELGAEAEKTAQTTAESLQNLNNNVLKLQNTVEDSRLIPFQNLGFRARAILRDLTNRYGKPAQLAIEGGQIELEIGAARTLEPVILHLIRNAYDHGLESPEERLANGKPEQGTITLSLKRRSNTFVLESRDDGRGIDAEAIQVIAKTLGLPLTNTQTPANLLAVICQPGFSSASQVSDLSGRGVGMDVIADRIARLGGKLNLATIPGKGTTFYLHFPVPHLLVPCVLLQAGNYIFAIPTEDIATTNVLGNLQATKQEKSQYLYSWEIQGETGTIPGLDLLEYWQPSSTVRSLEDTAICVYIRSSNQAQQGVWLLADELLGQSELSLNPLPAPLISPEGLIGVSLQANGSVIPVLGGTTLAERLLSDPSDTAIETTLERSEPQIQELDRFSQTILIVDDAALMRRRLEASLSAYGYVTHTCADGLEAWNWLQNEAQPVLIITDIEMPNMDGFTLIDRTREAGIKSPILVISSRLSQEWGKEARRLGANDYLTKGFSTSELINKVHSLLSLDSSVAGSTFEGQ